MKRYEDALSDIEAVPTSSASGVRDITWITDANVIGVARDQAGRLEVFLVGDELKAASSTVCDALEYHTWHRDFGQPLTANRLLLPALGHFTPVAAFVCTELLRNGADDDLARAFRVTEPIIELAIKRLELSQAALLGLAGELLMLSALCKQADDSLVASVLASWDGWRRSARDFRWDRTGVELKTTTRSTSSHMVQGVHQIEPAEGERGENGEARLLLVSVGLQPADPGPNSISIPALVQRVVNRLEATGNASQVHEFLTRVSRYGSESGFGYEHPMMAKDAPFTSTFTVAFFRGYDMSDPLIEVLRRDDVATRHHVEMQSVTFRISLPATVTGQNPVAGAHQVARSILGL